jgi:diguanylate cyclase (GGDEF)-like protein
MSFMLVDVDDFANYNDRNGHSAGDQALQIVAQCLKNSTRAADVVARYGGEEFCILLPQSSSSEAVSVAERARLRIDSTQFPHGKNQPLGRVTVSIGISHLCQQLNSADQLIYAADQALYQAKIRGKNRVHEWSDPSSSA